MRWKRRRRRGSAGNPQPPTTTLGAPARDQGLCGQRAGAELEGPGRRGGAPAAAKATSSCFQPVLLCTSVVSTGPCKEATRVAFLHPRAEGSAVVQGTHVCFPATELGWPQASVPSLLNALPHPGNMTATLGNIET